MATNVEIASGEASHRSILEIDKSNEPFPTRIAEVCDILGIQLKRPSIDVFSEDLIELDVQRFGPREEWALRWLLKNLQSSDQEPSSQGLDYNAWLLLGELVVCTTRSNIARLLNAYKFTTTVQKSIEWLSDQVSRIAYVPRSLTADDGVANADSSSTTVEDSLLEGSRRSRKRKRDGSYKSANDRSFGSETHIELLYTSIFAVVKRLETLTKGSSEVLQNFTIEHLKSILKTTPEQAAKILGCSLEIASLFMNSQRRSSEIGQLANFLESDNQDQCGEYVTSVHVACISSAVKIWTSRSVIGDDLQGQISYRMFSIHCLVPVLQFLNDQKNLSPPFPSNEKIIKVLEDLLINNIVLPARGTFLSPKSFENPESEAQSLSAEKLLAPLVKVPNMKFQGHGFLKNPDLGIPIIPLLFSAAIRSLPRITPKQRSLEDSWLRHLFHQLGQCAHGIITQSTMTLQFEQYIASLNPMLSEAVSHKVRLGDSRFEAILDRVQGVPDEEFDAPDTLVYWTFMGLCLEIHPKIFTSRSSVDKIDEDNSAPAPNKYFASLISRVTNTTWNTSSPNDFNQNARQLKIFLPLAQAFANARDLMTFIFHWQEQLTICQQHRHQFHSSRKATHLVTSIWEDEKLLLHIGTLIDSSLTMGQIDSMFQKVNASVAPSPLIKSKDDYSTISSLVIFDCFVSGLTRESILDQLEETARSAYITVLNILPHVSISSLGGQIWRLWRILATFNDRWSIVQYPGAAKDAEEFAVEKATESIRTVISTETKQVAKNFTNELHAFSFLMSTSYAHVNELNVSQTQFHPIIPIIEKMLDCRQTFCDSVDTKINESTSCTVQWNGKNETVTSIDILILGCISRILVSPSVVSWLPPNILRRFFRHLFWSAVASKGHLGSAASSSINYLSLWNRVLKSDVLRNYTSVAEIFRDLQIRTFLDIVDAQSPNSAVLETEGYRLAFRGIQITSVGAFDRGQRKKIFNAVLRLLLSKAQLNVAMTVDHINVLVDYGGVFNNSWTLLGVEYSSAEKSLEGFSHNEAPLLSLARQLDSNQDPEFSRSIETAVTQLVQLTLRNCISTLAHERNVKCLASFYDQLIDIGANKLKVPCQFFISVLFDTFSVFSMHGNSEFPENLKAKLDRIITMCHQQFEDLCRVFCKTDFTNSTIKELATGWELNMTLKSLVFHADFLHVYPNLDKILVQLANIAAILHNLKAIESLEDFDDDWDCLDYLLVQITRIRVRLGLLNNVLPSEALQAIEILRTLKSPRERKALLRQLQDAISASSSEDRTELLRMLMKADDDGHLRVEYLPLLEQVVRAEQASKTNKEPYTIEVSQAFATLCNGFIKPTEFRLRISLMRSMILLLQKEPRIISQWHIDNTLAAIAVVSSQLASLKDEKATDVAYMGLCRTFRTVLTTHRKKLGGRNHLVIPALQSLLRCLFIPYSPPDSSPVPESQTSALGESHAAAYGRLLTMICDPTVSAVSRSSKPHSRRPALNDETKTARSIAGQHLQYLLMDYCKSQLKGILPPALKTALTPGLYAILDVVTPEVLRTINAAMDPSSRSIFKALYDQHRRAPGRWHGT